MMRKFLFQQLITKNCALCYPVFANHAVSTATSMRDQYEHLLTRSLKCCQQ